MWFHEEETSEASHKNPPLGSFVKYSAFWTIVNWLLSGLSWVNTTDLRHWEREEGTSWAKKYQLRRQPIWLILNRQCGFLKTSTWRRRRAVLCLCVAWRGSASADRNKTVPLSDAFYSTLECNYLKCSYTDVCWVADTFKKGTAVLFNRVSVSLTHLQWNVH